MLAGKKAMVPIGKMVKTMPNTPKIIEITIQNILLILLFLGIHADNHFILCFSATKTHWKRWNYIIIRYFYFSILLLIFSNIIL